MTERIEIIQGDITKFNVDAIVNAANESLLGGGGVDGAIHRAAGPKLLEECTTLHGCNTGKAKITKGYNLPAKWVIHTVGPIWHGGNQGEDELLAECYRNSLKLTEPNNIKIIAFPSISTGAYRFPIDLAAGISINEIRKFLELDTNLEKIYLICFDDSTYNIYKQKLLGSE